MRTPAFFDMCDHFLQMKEETTMSKIMELRNKRTALWEQTKAFLEEHRDENGLVAKEAVEQYDRMAADVRALGAEITLQKENPRTHHLSHIFFPEATTFPQTGKFTYGSRKSI